MAVANTKSTQITNADAAPRVVNDVRSTHGRTRTSKATVAVLAADDDTSVFRFVRVHSSWSVVSIQILNDAIAAATVYHCGLHQTAANGGAVLDADCYASSVDINAGTTAWLELAYEARNITAVGQRVYEDGGVSTDPNIYYDITLTGATVGTAAGDITMVVQYLAGD